MLFGGALSAERLRSARARRAEGPCTARAADGNSSDTTLTVDGWIKFRVPRRVERLMIELRTQLDRLLQQKMTTPSIQLTEAGSGLLAAITALLASPPPGA